MSHSESTLIDVTREDVRAAASRLTGWVHRTPVMTSHSIDDWVGVQVVCKCENLQRVGAFKYRGALNAVLHVKAKAPTPSALSGVAAHSSGNHAQALALAARKCDLPAFIVMPSNAPSVKRAAVESYGAEIITCEPTLAAREATLADVIEQTGAVEIHPYDNPQVIAGAGTAALELLGSVDHLDAIVAPVGGGGLLSGTALAASASPSIDVWGAEPAGADDAYRSLEAGHLIPSEDPDTIADGLLTSLRPRTFAIISAHAAGIVRVTDDEIREAMTLVWERAKLVIEPSAAVAVAGARALARQTEPAAPGHRIGVILSGGNVDLPPF